MPQKPKRNERSGFEMAKKGFIAEFKEFIARGNVMDLAVGFLRIQSACQIVKGHFDNVLAYFFRIVHIVC